MRLQPTHRHSSGQRRAALTLFEVLLILALAVVLLLLFAPVFIGPRPYWSVECVSNLKQLTLATLTYATHHGAQLPPAWHVAGKPVSADLSNLSYWRLSLLPYMAGDPESAPTANDLRWLSSDSLGRGQGRWGLTTGLWTCPEPRGWTRDYFGSSLAFDLPADPHAPMATTADIDTLAASIPSSRRPFLADVSASLPDPRAADPEDPGHEAEMRQGFAVRGVAGINVFVGVGASRRDRADPTTTRFDDRHAGRIAVAYLDGHAALVRGEAGPDARELHRFWNTLTVAADEP